MHMLILPALLLYTKLQLNIKTLKYYFQRKRLVLFFLSD